MVLMIVWVKIGSLHSHHGPCLALVDASEVGLHFPGPCHGAALAPDTGQRLRFRGPRVGPKASELMLSLSVPNPDRRACQQLLYKPQAAQSQAFFVAPEI